MADRPGPVIGGQAPVQDLVEAIDSLLPQTQCRKCGFDGCRPYATAMSTGDAAINRCPPGGAEGISRLAELLQVPALPLDPACGEESPPKLALIDESICIGCTLCIQACPVDAIVGAPRRMHTVLLAHCTGCELCLAPCPVDCIAKIEVEQLAAQGIAGALERQSLDALTKRRQSRDRYLAHTRQVVRLQSRNDARLARKARHKLEALQGGDEETRRKRETVMRALERARLRRGSPPVD